MVWYVSALNQFRVRSTDHVNGVVDLQVLICQKLIYRKFPITIRNFLEKEVSRPIRLTYQVVVPFPTAGKGKITHFLSPHIEFRIVDRQCSITPQLYTRLRTEFVGLCHLSLMRIAHCENKLLRNKLVMGPTQELHQQRSVCR